MSNELKYNRLFWDYLIWIRTYWKLAEDCLRDMKLDCYQRVWLQLRLFLPMLIGRWVETYRERRKNAREDEASVQARG